MGAGWGRGFGSVAEAGRGRGGAGLGQRKNKTACCGNGSSKTQSSSKIRFILRTHVPQRHNLRKIGQTLNIGRKICLSSGRIDRGGSDISASTGR